MTNTKGRDYCTDSSTLIKDKLIAQTIFLGASVIDYNANIGWGAQPSTLTVNLVNDLAATGCPQGQFPGGPPSDNSYYTANNDSLYINKAGATVTRSDPEAMLPGKVYYDTSYHNTYQVVQKWWQGKDPGFLGDATNITSNGSVRYSATAFNHLGWDITNCPVYFKMGNFSFGGFVQSWKKNKGQNGDIYTVVVNSAQAILNNCTIIMDKYGGAISGRTSFAWSAPGNYVGNLLTYNNTNNSYGNIPNIFNVYGFLESFGAGFFGGSSYNSAEGFLYTEVLSALRVLTGATSLSGRASTSHSDFGPKNAFSPYGRIIAPTVNDPVNGTRYTSSLWGVIKPTSNTLWTGRDRCSFKLDLSELSFAISDSDKRIKTDSMSITEFLDKLCEEHGLDWTTTMLNTSTGWVIKVVAVNRRFAPLVNGVKSTVSKLICDGYDCGNFSYGKEANDTASRALIIGPNQQRLYQAKSTRLAYTQSCFIFYPDGNTGRFVDYYQVGKITPTALSSQPSCTDNTGSRSGATGTPFDYGKIKFPAFYSTRNPVLDIRQPSLKNDELVKNAIEGLDFNDRDNDFEDSELSSNFTKVRSGNYKNSKIISHGRDARFGLHPCPGTINFNDTSLFDGGGGLTDKRFFPLFRDVICPFFGYLFDNRFSVKAENKNTDFKRIRPVWYDFWTGQIVVLFHVNELPRTRIGLRGRYTYGFNRSSSVSMLYPDLTIGTAAAASGDEDEGPIDGGVPVPPASQTAQTPDVPTYTQQWFMVTESEIRAAMAGADSYISYTLGKLYKTDLYIMLWTAYYERSKAKFQGEGAADYIKKAKDENDWTWKYLAAGNLSNAEGITTEDRIIGSDSLYSLSSEARKDFDLIADFLKNVGNEFYGKKYMVTAPYLQSRTEQEPYDYQLQTDLGHAPVFKGGGEIRYNYEPCAADNGAWEEYGNQIDDSITVGDNHWSALSNDKGQINPILGYNNTDQFDYFRYELARNTYYRIKTDMNPLFSYSAWDDAVAVKRGEGLDRKKYLFENIKISDLAGSMDSFVIVTGLNNASLINRFVPFGGVFTRPSNIAGLDAFGNNNLAAKKKLYKTCSVEPKFSFIDPEKMLEPKIIVNTDRLTLNNTSEQHQTDPSNTVSAIIGMEDLSIYIRAGGRRQSTINFLTRFFIPYIEAGRVLRDINETFDATNPTGRNTPVAPKCAHPFFAGIPIRSNTYCYGPWTNYPYDQPFDTLFQSGTSYQIDNPSTAFDTCTATTINLPSNSEADLLIDNWITDTKFEIIDDFAPWNFGGMRKLDDIAMKYVSGVANYQTSIEVGSFQAPGTPMFNIGGCFSVNTMTEDTSFTDQTETFTYTEVKEGSLFPNNWPILTNSNYNDINDPGYLSGQLTFTVPDIAINDLNGNRIRYDYYSQAPILTNIITSMSQNGINTTYSFRTYTRKLSLFNRQEIERSKKLALQNIARKKEISKLEQRINNNQFMDKERIKRAQDFQSNGSSAGMTLGNSPVTTIVSSAYAFHPKYTNLDDAAEFSSYASPEILAGSAVDNRNVNISGTSDPGGSGQLVGGFSTQTSSSQLAFSYLEHRVHTETKIYPDSELGDSLRNSWARSSVMSLDGLFSPISFYPTIGKETFSMSKYDTRRCPICKGTKSVSRKYKRYKTASNPSSSSGSTSFVCDSCVKPYQKINASTYFGTTTTSKDGEYFPPYIVSTGNTLDELKKFNTFIYQRSIQDKTDRIGLSVTVPINMNTLQPIVMPKHEFRNANAQNYEGAHPYEMHGSLSVGGKQRNFVDRGRNSIAIIGRGTIYKDIMANLKAHENIGQGRGVSQNVTNYDYDFEDSRFIERFSHTNYDATLKKRFEQNMRFVGFRGPMMLHGWGYDNEGYPVPNAADEPLQFDSMGRPLRFAVSRTVESATVPYDSLAVGEAFCTNNQDDTTETVKLHSLKLQNETPYSRGGDANLTKTSNVYRIIYKDDYTSAGYTPGVFNGSIVSKTQYFDGARYTPKVKLKEFYLNWAERPDLWPVGPIDLRWDQDRRVWTTNTQKIYKMVYVTLEEDMYKDPDLDETFPARGFLDEAEYATTALDTNERRLVYVKDRSGYTAPRGARIYCKYDSDTGFYEPISKQQFVVYGSISSGTNYATITMSYVQGKKRGESTPTMSVTFKNPLGLSTINGVGMFSYIDGEWTLISTRS